MKKGEMAIQEKVTTKEENSFFETCTFSTLATSYSYIGLCILWSYFVVFHIQLISRELLFSIQNLFPFERVNIFPFYFVRLYSTKLKIKQRKSDEEIKKKKIVIQIIIITTIIINGIFYSNAFVLTQITKCNEFTDGTIATEQKFVELALRRLEWNTK